MFDYEWASVQHHVNCRLARAVVVPAAIPPERLQPYGAAGKIRSYAGLKEEYYLADFDPDPAILVELALDSGRPLVVIRTPPEVSLYHRFANDLFADVLTRARDAATSDDGVQVVVLPRTADQRAELGSVPGFVVPAPRDRCPVPDRPCRPRDLRRRHHEPRGGRARDPRVHDVRGTSRGRGRAPDRRTPPTQAHRPRRAELCQASPARRASRTRRDPGLLVELLLSPLDSPARTISLMRRRLNRPPSPCTAGASPARCGRRAGRARLLPGVSAALRQRPRPATTPSCANARSGGCSAAA